MEKHPGLAANCLVAVLMVTVMPFARAEEHRTVIDVPYAVQVDQTVLQPGTYMIRMMDSTAGINVVQILNKDGNKVIASIQGIPVERSQTTATTQFWFAKTPVGQPRIVRAWFYPGEEIGLEIVAKKSPARSGSK